MNPASVHAIGDLAVPVQSIAPQSSVAATVAGSAVDRFAHNLPASCVLRQCCGAVTGAPSAINIIVTLEHSPDSTNWATYYPGGGPVPAATPPLTAASTDASIPVNLGSAMRYIRASMVVAFTGGSAPAALVASDIVLGGEPRLAAI